MTDREMLELAAKALGMPEAPKQYRIADGLPIVITYMGKPWNPLTDDGDALRLAVELRIKVEFGNDEVATDWPVSERYTTRPDGASSIEGRCAATRRAIVRAAAEIGRQMEEQS